MKLTKGFSIVGFCTGVAGLITSIVAVTFSAVAFFRVKKHGK